MKISEIRQKTSDELISALEVLSRECFNLKMLKGTGQLQKNAQIKKVRRDIARVKTVITESKSNR